MDKLINSMFLEGYDMLQVSDIETKLKETKGQLEREFNVERIGIFGSFARGEQTEDSDIDILVKFSKPVGWEFIDLKEYLENILGRRVDLVTENALKLQLRDQILSEVIYQ